MTHGRYVVVSPARDEAQFAERTLRSIASQTRQPDLWVVVDDGSTDDTPRILDAWRAKVPYLRVMRLPARRERSVGPGVVNAFYAGLDTVELDGFDYLCKLDLDLDIPPRYFEVMLERMASDPRLGTCSGKAYFPDSDGRLVSEGIGDEMSLGMIKFYRTTCFRQIGGFVREVMWDGIDCHRCRMLGWIACSWDEPEIRFTHLRPMGSSQVSIWEGRKRHGRGQYFMGTSLPYMTASSIYRMTRAPLLVGGLAMWWGFMLSMVAGRPRLEDPDFRRFLRRCQWAMLIRGKRSAIAALHRNGSTIWDPERPSPWDDGAIGR
jgi:poly-beta-1,6-N-acetyl-D-glucosamine synthase